MSHGQGKEHGRLTKHEWRHRRKDNGKKMKRRKIEPKGVSQTDHGQKSCRKRRVSIRLKAKGKRSQDLQRGVRYGTDLPWKERNLAQGVIGHFKH